MLRSNHASKSPSPDLYFPADPATPRSSNSPSRLYPSTPNADPDDSNSSSPSSPDDPSSNSSDSSDDFNDPQPQPPLRVPPGGRPYVEPIQSHSLGPMNIQCPNCHALHFMSEKLTNSGVCEPRFDMCCLQGQVNLLAIQQWPCIFDDPQDRRQFKKKIRQYNNTLAFISVGVDVDNQTIQGSGPSLFCIHDTLHHLMGALIPPDGLQPSFAQLYIYDPEEATNRHVQGNPQLNPGILLDLHTILRNIHPYASLYKQAYEIMRVSPSLLIFH